MEQYILKEKIGEAIKCREVKAVLFYTFNFNPRFFENYVMPLFVPSKDFRDEVIHNRILWRTCMKEGLIPPVTVYCDYFAKDNTEAPSLGYAINCIRVPAANGAICNFHPKQILILLQDKIGDESLLMVTGSGNITPAGWCDNFESFTIEEIKKDKRFPNKTTSNILQSVIENINLLARTKETLVEQKIKSFLNYVDYVDNYFNSVQESFKAFLDRMIFSVDDIKEVEIISPYFCPNDTLFRHLKDSIGIKKVRSLIPTFKDNEVQLSKEVFDVLTEAGIIWCCWNTHSQDGKVLDRNKEVRKLHSKIYRFYGKKNSYTFIGSVNFTTPAWEQFSDKNNKANIENGWLYAEPAVGRRLLKQIEELNYDYYIFVDKIELENGEVESVISRKVPDFVFVINWRQKTLIVKGKSIANNCSLSDLSDTEHISNGERIVYLTKEDIKSLSKNSIIKVVEELETEKIVHTYYPVHLHIEMKPLEIKLTTSNILRYWDFLDDEKKREVLTRGFAEKMTNDIGAVDEEQIETRNVLNEMAAHFCAFVKLEKFLFNAIRTKTEQKQKFKELAYYLVSDNIDTLPFYLESLEKQLEEKKVFKSFCWMVYQIVLENFYGKAKQWEYRRQYKDEWKIFRKKLDSRIKEINKKADLLHSDIDISEQQIKWCKEQIAVEYD